MAYGIGHLLARDLACNIVMHTHPDPAEEASNKPSVQQSVLEAETESPLVIALRATVAWGQWVPGGALLSMQLVHVAGDGGAHARCGLVLHALRQSCTACVLCN